VLRRRDDLGEYARRAQELTLDSARSHGYFQMSTELCSGAGETIQFHVYQLCIRGSARAGMHDVVRRRTQCERRFIRSVESNYPRTQRVCRVENLYELNTVLDTIIAHRRNLLQARATPPTRNGVRDVIDHVTI